MANVLSIVKCRNQNTGKEVALGNCAKSYARPETAVTPGSAPRRGSGLRGFSSWRWKNTYLDWDKVAPVVRSKFETDWVEFKSSPWFNQEGPVEISTGENKNRRCRHAEGSVAAAVTVSREHRQVRRWAWLKPQLGESPPLGRTHVSSEWKKRNL